MVRLDGTNTVVGSFMVAPAIQRIYKRVAAETRSLQDPGPTIPHRHRHPRHPHQSSKNTHRHPQFDMTHHRSRHCQ